VLDDGTSQPAYFPNHRYNAHAASDAKKEAPLTHNWKPVMMHGVADRVTSSRNDPTHRDHTSKMDDEFEQCRELLFRVMNDYDREQLYLNTAYGLSQCKSSKIVMRYLAMCYRVHRDYAGGIIAQTEKMRAKAADKNTTPPAKPVDLPAAATRGHGTDAPNARAITSPTLSDVATYVNTYTIDPSRGYIEVPVSEMTRPVGERKASEAATKEKAMPGHAPAAGAGRPLVTTH